MRPVLSLYSIPEFRDLIRGFRQTTLVPERFPVRSRLHKGWKAVAYNGVFVGAFNAIPRSLVRRVRMAPDGDLREVGVGFGGRRSAVGSCTDLGRWAVGSSRAQSAERRACAPLARGYRAAAWPLWYRRFSTAARTRNFAYGATCLIAATFIWHGLRQVGHFSSRIVVAVRLARRR